MKTTLKLLFILFFFVYNGNIFAQGPPKLQRQHTARGTNNEYSVRKYDDFYSISNVKKMYENVDPNYTGGMEDYAPIAILSKEDRQRLEQLTDSIIGDCVAKTTKTWDSLRDHASIFMRSDMKGKINDVLFIFPNALSIPVEKIEALETLIKKEITLQFKIDHRNKDAVYMQQSWTAKFEPMREKRKK